jgi:hypothetical protein
LVKNLIGVFSIRVIAIEVEEELVMLVFGDEFRIAQQSKLQMLVEVVKYNLIKLTFRVV